MPLKLACLATDWGRLLHAAALARGINSTLVDSRHTPTPASVLFCRPPQRDPAQAVSMALAHIRGGGKCVQSVSDLRCYERRDVQMELLDTLYPPGEVVRTMDWAEEAIHILGLPIVSKAPFGSSSHTVRLLATREEALADAREVLTRGKSFRSGLSTQYGMALWQKFLPRNEYALRVTQITERYGWVFKVMNRPHDWRASGSGVCVPIQPDEVPKFRDAIDMHLEVAKRMNSRWLGTDMLYDPAKGRWYCVDVTLAWSWTPKLLGAHWDAHVIDLHTLAPLRDTQDGVSLRRGAEQWQLLLEGLVEQYR